MRLARLLGPRGPRVARVEGDALLPPGAASIPGVFDPPLEAEMPLGSATLLAPVRPSKIAAIGRNYAAHARELGNTVPTRPLLFLKAPSTIVGPGAPILLPRDSVQVEHEAELGVVIGRRGRHVQVPDAMAHVFGYVCLNDVTARDLQKRDVQFGRAKNFDTFCPVGPWVETELSPEDLRVSCRVGGETRQDGRTSDMVFPVAVILSTVSRVFTLEPGDLIATGTPEGVSVLRAGQWVEVEVEGIGVLRNPVAEDPESGPSAPPVGEQG
jgi:2-keto-4-pentenoate hydratase/2-oxohepta-3-ene-1,7-dioic acid hydratase in catechol pathway